MTVSAAARSKVSFYGFSNVEVVGPNPAGVRMSVMNVKCCQVQVSATS